MKYSKLDVDIANLEMIFDKMVEIHVPITNQNITNFLMFIYKLKRSELVMYFEKYDK